MVWIKIVLKKKPEDKSPLFNWSTQP